MKGSTTNNLAGSTAVDPHPGSSDPLQISTRRGVIPTDSHFHYLPYSPSVDVLSSPNSAGLSRLFIPICSDMSKVLHHSTVYIITDQNEDDGTMFERIKATYTSSRTWITYLFFRVERVHRAVVFDPFTTAANLLIS
jgi:hypothetical protein